MKRITLLILPSLMALAAAAHAAAARPNVVLLLSDDLGFKDIGSYDGPVRTPTLDRLAENGVRFTDFYSGCASAGRNPKSCCADDAKRRISIGTLTRRKQRARRRGGHGAFQFSAVNAA